MELALDVLRRVFEYDPSTGEFTNRSTLRKVGAIDKDGYLSIRPMKHGKAYRAHRLAWFYMTGGWPAHGIDHINGVKVDNRWVNLREATDSENLQNLKRARRDSKSGLLGVDFHKGSQRWRSQIKIDGVKIHLGYFDSAVEAHAAYLKAKQKYHPFGELAELPRWLIPHST